MKSSDKKIEWLKTQRIGDRLIGGFEWSHYGRSFDGVKVAREDNFSHVQAAALIIFRRSLPEAGVFCGGGRFTAFRGG